MVAIITGAGLGLERSSGLVLGSGGRLGSSAFGRLGENVTVNAATGNLFVDRTDEILIGLGLDGTVARSYNSLGDASDDNGDNWRLSAQKIVAGLTGTLNTAGSTVVRTDWDGSQTIYSYNAAAGAYVSQQGGSGYDTLTFSSTTNQWTWTDGSSRTVEAYDANNGGRIVSRSDTSGNAVSYAYTGNLLTRITTQDGEHTDLTWSGNNLTQITTSLSSGTTLTRTRYTYDTSNRLSTVTTDLTPNDNSVADGNVVTTTYTYDGTSDRIAGISQTGGASLVIGYTLVGSTYRVTSLAQTTAAGVTSTTNLSYDTANGVTSITDAQGQVTRLSYDANNQLTQVTLPAAQSGAAAQVMRYTYDGAGNIASATDALGNVTTYAYDSKGNLTLVRDAVGNTVTRTYSSDNQLLTETAYAIPDPDGSGTAQPGQPVTTRYVYDSQDRLRFVIDPLGYVTEYVYNAAGQQTSSIIYRNNAADLSGKSVTDTFTCAQMTNWVAGIADKSGINRTDTTYDFRGNINTVTSYSAVAANGTGLTSQPYTVVTYVYDQYGNLLSRQPSTSANAEVYSYDGLGRVVSATDLNGGTTNVVFSDGLNKTVTSLASGLVKTSIYNLSGQLISTTISGSGITSGTTSYAYDSVGNLRMVTDALGNKSYYLYDAVGRKVASIAADGSISEFRYNADNQLVATIAYATRLSSGALASLVNGSGNPANVVLSGILPVANAADVWTWNIYDHAGRLIENIDGNGDVTVFTYDGMSNKTATTSYANALSSATLAGFRTSAPTTLQLPVADSAHDAVTRYFYDADNRLVGTLNADGYLAVTAYVGLSEKWTTVYANATGQSVRATGSLADLIASITTSSRDIRTGSIYDNAGRLEFTLDSTLRPTQYVYDAVGNLVQTIVYGGSIASTSGDCSASYIAGQISALSLVSNSATRTSWAVYDAAGRVAYSIDAQGDVIGYSYDTSGNVIKQVAYATQRPTASSPSLATMNSWAASQSTANDRVSRMIYNAAGELVYSADPEGYVTERRYDVDGNATRVIRYATAFSVGDGMTAASMATLIGPVPATAVQTSYAYDVDGRLVDSYDGNGICTHLVYNALGLVTDKTVAYGIADAQTTHLEYDAVGRLRSQTDAYGTSAASTISYTYDGLGNILTAVDGRGHTTSYTYDALGRLLTKTTPIDGSTNAVTTNVYNAFGDVVQKIDPLGNSTYFYYDNLDRLTLQVDADGFATQMTYGLGSEVASVTHFATAVSGNIATAAPPAVSTSAKDAVTSFTRDRLGRVTQATDAEGFYEQYTLNAFGDRIAVRNKLGGVTNNVFDHRGLLVSETLPENSVRPDGSIEATSVTNTFQYDARGNRTRMIEAYGLSEQRITNYSYDNNDRLIQTSGDAVSVVAADLATVSTVTPTTTQIYDVNGNVIETRDPAGARTLYYYDALNRRIAEVNAMGTLSTWSYDQNSNVTSQRVYSLAVALPATPGGAAPSPVAGSGYRETNYTYDYADRLLTTGVANVQVGQYGSSYTVSTATATITNAYDGSGNLVRQTDANGNNVYYYYDKAGHKVAQIDQSNYLTTYQIDADGNVLTETRYATALSSTPTTSSNPATLSAGIAGNANDRVTNFTYDRNGRRLTEQRLNVDAWSVNAGNGALSAAPRTAIITYTYNGLGEVTSKTEATGESTNYTYDAAGRQTQITQSAFTDYAGASVQNVSVQSYDGLNNLTRTVSNGTRVTTSSYGAGGRLTSMTDASGFTINYQYDAAGRVVKQSYVRVQADGTRVTEAKACIYDAVGRTVSQFVATWNGSSWIFGDQRQVNYNAYGEICSRGVNGLIQETSSYDNAGRVWRTTADDGTIKLYGYDANGNQTLKITSDGKALPSGYSWSTITFGQAIALLTNSGANAIGAAAVSGMVVTITVYDKRGQTVQTIEPQRQLSDSAVATLTKSRSYNAFGEVIQDTNANGNPTNYVYNTLGKIVQQISPTVNQTLENGAVQSIRPTQTNYYDLSGRLIGVRDANGNLNTRVLLSGTGYGGADASVVKEFHPDGGIVAKGYDVFGDLRQTTNEIGSVESFAYDAMGRLVTDTHPTRLAGTAGNNTNANITLVDYYSYDGLGQRIQHWNSNLGATAMEKTFYDAQGRVTQTSDMAGHVTTYGYSWSSSIATPGLGTFGGWTKTTTNPAGLTSTENIDVFGRTVSRTDFGGHQYSFAFDMAGRLVSLISSTSENKAYFYYNTGNLASIANHGVAGNSTTTRTTSEVPLMGDLRWVPGDPGTKDSWGNIVGATPGYYVRVAHITSTSTTETTRQGVWVPGDAGWTDNNGVVHDATNGYYATDATDVTNTTGVLSTQTTVTDTTTYQTPTQRTSYTYDAVGNRTSEAYYNDVLTTVTVASTITTDTETQTWVTTTNTVNGVTSTTVSGTYQQTLTGTQFTIDPAKVVGLIWVPGHPATLDSYGNVLVAATPGYYEREVTGYTTQSVTDYALVDLTNCVWVPATTDSYGHVISGGYYQRLVTTTTTQSVTDYAQVDLTGCTWFSGSPGTQDSWGHTITAATPGYYAKLVTTTTTQSVTDYAQVDTSGCIWVAASGSTPGHYERPQTGYQTQNVTDYAQVDLTGCTWFSGSSGTKDSWGNTITAPTPGYYAKQVTTQVSQWIPPVYNSWGYLTSGGYYYTYNTTTWQVVQPTTHSVQVPYTYYVVVQPTTHDVQVTTQSWQVVQPTTHNVQVSTQSWQAVSPTTHSVQVPYTNYVVVDPSTYTVQTSYTYTQSAPYSYTHYAATPRSTTSVVYTDTPTHTSTNSSDTTSTPTSTPYQNETITYDAMNRVVTVNDSGYGNAAPVSIQLTYDANSNVRERKTSYHALSYDGKVMSNASTEDDWYKYDSMNRFVTTKGSLSGTPGAGTIVRGFSGTDLLYDHAGNRIAASTTKYYSGSSYKDSFGNTYVVSQGGVQEQTENYVYTADGYLAQVSLAYGAMGQDVNTVPHSSGPGTKLATYQLDAMGRATLYTEYSVTYGNSTYTRTATYDADSNVIADTTTSVRSDGYYVANTTYDYNLRTASGRYDGAYQGVMVHSHTTATLGSTAQPDSDTTNTYQWWNGAKLSFISGSQGSTTYQYDNAGNLTTVYIQDGQPRNIYLVNNIQGEVIKRDVVYGSGINAPHELRYYVNGTPVGDVTTDGAGTSDIDYVTSVAQRSATQGYGAFQNGASTGSLYANFDQSYDPINGFHSATAPQTYTVAQGDTLQNIAQQVWGDASLWYLIAEANGVTSNTSLVAGMMLTIPDKVTNIHNAATTYRVYDPNAAVGDTSPTKVAPPPPPAPQPSKHGGGCGIFGQIILVVVAIVATVLTAGALSGATASLSTMWSAGMTTLAGGSLANVGIAVVAGAVGSMVSQGIGVATGLQSEFSWAGVAMSAIGAGVGAGLGSIIPGESILPTVARGIAGNAITQGIAVATGLQKKFDWAGVAAAGVGAAVGAVVGSQLTGVGGIWAATAASGQTVASGLTRFVSGMASDIANAATRTLINGSDFGDNIIAVLPDTIGQTIGNLVAEGALGVGGPFFGDGGDGNMEVHVTGKPMSLESGIVYSPIENMGMSNEQMSNLINSNMPIFNDDGTVSYGPPAFDSAMYNGHVDVQSLDPVLGTPTDAYNEYPDGNPTDVVVPDRTPQTSVVELGQPRSLREGQLRRLTKNEETILKQAFGGDLNTDTVRIAWTSRDSVVPRADDALIRTNQYMRDVDGKMRTVTVFWFRADAYSDDLGAFYRSATDFVHEATHLWQATHGIDIYAKEYEIIKQYGYAGNPKAYVIPWRNLGNMSWNDLNIEQQAELVSYRWAHVYGNYRYPVGTPTKVIDGLIPFHVERR
jgi:YD repeat-containing protein